MAAPLLAGQVLRALDINNIITDTIAANARGEIDHVVAAGDQLIANANTEFTSIALSVPVEADRKIEVRFRCNITSSDAGDGISIWVTEDDVNIADDPADKIRATIDSAGGDVPAYWVVPLTNDDAGFRTFTVVVSRPFGTGTGGYRKGAVLSVHDCGPA